MNEMDADLRNTRHRGGYDLHVHSTRSDGTVDPSDLPGLARAVGLRGFALTDHDTTAGWDAARAGSQQAGIDFLPGMEITTRFALSSTHLLAYGFNADDADLNAELLRVRESRLGRAKEMVSRLSQDFDISWDAVHDGDAEITVGRPHIADALVTSGYFPNRDGAFATVLSSESPYYVHTYAIDTAHAIGLVRAAGGAAVLAHPAAARHHRVIQREHLDELVDAGLWGIELEHPENLADRIPALRAVAAVHGLWITGASDYHGTGKSNRLGEFRTSQETFEALREAVTVKG